MPKAAGDQGTAGRRDLLLPLFRDAIVFYGVSTIASGLLSASTRLPGAARLHLQQCDRCRYVHPLCRGQLQAMPNWPSSSSLCVSATPGRVHPDGHPVPALKRNGIAFAPHPTSTTPRLRERALHCECPAVIMMVARPHHRGGPKRGMRLPGQRPSVAVISYEERGGDGHRETWGRRPQARMRDDRGPLSR